MSGTEARNPRSASLASFSTRQILMLMNDEDAGVPAAVRAALADIELATEAVVEAFARGGRLRYVGAGTSGRLGVLDASEAPPTFGVPPELVRGLIAGGDDALRSAIEGAEDDAGAGARDAREAVRAGDVVVGISASGRARYVIAALAMAREIGARTAALTCDRASPLAGGADIVIAVDVGPEILAGSSRLKAGTATKLVLNMISTAAMIRSGRTRGDLMVDLRATNTKLRARAVRMVREVTGLDDTAATARLEAHGWSVRAALEEKTDPPRASGA
ncbi:MAG TPA: N-acetylmuramic acid 6-phosphate etherase [Candidatus Limnocylindria bacterium]|nr:N-acetylmuramic acid 6-phosphate etherase [Candidatus Limnocylindria bacterium]